MHQRQIFISGLHRSGTSLFCNTLCSAENFSGLNNTRVPEDEGQHLQDVFKPAKYYGGPGRFGFNSKCYMDEYHILATQENRKKIQSSWERFWDTSKLFLVEKSPPNIVRTRFLQYLYPEAVFFTIIRHPIAVSLATKKWSRTSINSLFSHWLKCHDTYMKDSKYLNNSYLFKYEDFVLNPKQVIYVISNILDYEINIPVYPKIKSDVNKKYFDIWDKKYKNNKLYRLNYLYLKNKYGHRFLEYGYDFEL